MPSKWFQFNPDREADTEFEKGELRHLSPGNLGRLLDFRRTPVRIEKLCDETGLATLRVLDFEDRGALWDLPYESVDKYQFRKGSASPSAEALERIKAAIARFDRVVEITGDAVRKEQTIRAIAQERERAEAWLGANSRFFRSGSRLPEGEVEGSALLWSDTKAYMEHRDVGYLEEVFTRNYVSQFFNEAVKAHRIAIAQTGLVPYRGKILRDPHQDANGLSFGNRANHVIVRMGLVQAIFRLSGREKVVLYRMESSEGALRPRDLGTVLISASFRRDIVEEMAGMDDPNRTVVLYRQTVPIERILMTYMETEAMNQPYQEAEAVLLADPNNRAF